MCAHRTSVSLRADSLTGSFWSRPILQYYCYLNLAMAVILAYRPPKWEAHRTHGVYDLTSKLTDRINLGSIVVETQRRGAIPLFHSVICEDSIAGRTVRLRELLVPITFVSFELIDAFGLNIYPMRVEESLAVANGEFVSKFTFSRLEKEDGNLIRRKIETLIPFLKSDYSAVSSGYERIHYEGKINATSKSAAERIHRERCLRALDVGGGTYVSMSNEVVNSYQHRAYVEMLPILTASVLLSFTWASVMRYRPMLARYIRESPFHLLLDTFVHEADGFVLPAFRNLLYREDTYVQTVDGL